METAAYYDLSPIQVSQLVQVINNIDLNKPADKQRLETTDLDEWINSPLSMEMSQVGQQSASLYRMTCQSLLQILSEPGAEVEDLSKIKEAFKRLSLYSDGKPYHQFCSNIYYAAIAAAQIFHQTSISSLTDYQLRDMYTSVQQQQDLPDPLQSLFQRALQ